MPSFSGLHATVRLLFNFALPHRCPLCQEIVETRGVCPPCWGRLTFLTEPWCARCGFPFELPIAPGTFCLRCAQNAPLALDWVRARLAYTAGARPILLRFKHGNGLELAPLLGQWIAALAQEVPFPVDHVLPVPLHWTRLWARQYNQSAFLAQAVAHSLRVPFCLKTLTRRRRTAPQEGSAKARARNVANAFCVKRDIAGQNVLLCDDVLTSGATLEGCAKALKDAGAAHVGAVALARVVGRPL